jgi:hypothetical protein
MEVRVEEEDREKASLRHQLDQSLENSHEVSLLNDRLGESERELLEEKVKSRDLELRNHELAESLI